MVARYMDCLRRTQKAGKQDTGGLNECFIPKSEGILSNQAMKSHWKLYEAFYYNIAKYLFKQSIGPF